MDSTCIKYFITLQCQVNTGRSVSVRNWFFICSPFVAVCSLFVLYLFAICSNRKYFTVCNHKFETEVVKYSRNEADANSFLRIFNPTLIKEKNEV